MSIPTSSQLRKAAKISEKIEALQSELEAILSGKGAKPRAKGKRPGGRKKRTLSPEARARISAAAKKRWKKAKAAGKSRL